MTQLTLVLPAPTVENETNGHLDPAAIPNTGVKITTPVYGGIEAGQWVGLEWTAVDPAGSLVLPARRLTTAQPLEFTVPKAVAELSQDKAVSVAYTVARVENGLVKTSEAVPFELAKIKAVTPPGTEGFDNVPVGPIAWPLRLSKFHMDVEIQMQAEIVQDPPVALEPFISGNALKYTILRDTATFIRIDLTPFCTALQFGLSLGGASGADRPLIVEYEGGQIRTMVVNSGWVRIDVKDNPTRRISVLYIYAIPNVNCYIDNFSFEYDPIL
ncbi:hypothetical protein IFT44_18825 [Pseudomonas sp. CFBP 13710]|nr:hypothetical protein [Pseudomonas sp. CFBP 13710]